MTTSVILSMSSSDSVEVNRPMFKQITGYAAPWAQTDRITGERRLYGRCPSCRNAVQLINISAPQPGLIPHGRHQLRRVDGFPYCLEEILGCKEFTGKSRSTAERRLYELTPQADALRRGIPKYFDQMVALFREDTGLILGVETAAKVLSVFLRNKRYRWPITGEENIAWLFAYVGETFSLYGQKVIPGSDLAQALAHKVAGVRLTEAGQIHAERDQRIALFFGLRFHRVAADRDQDGESIQFFVNDLSRYSGDPEDSRTVFEKTIRFRLDALPKAIALRASGRATQPQSEYARRLNERARDVLDTHLRSEGAAPS